MVKSIIIDEQANKSLESLLTRDNLSKTGLLIGTFDQNKDFITNVIATPFNVNSAQDANSDQIDSDWVINHALLIHDMLIGGSDILGIFTIDVSPTITRQILTKLFKELNEFDYYKQMKFNSERLAFLVDSKSKNINMKCLDLNLTGIEQQKTTFQTCEIKIQKGLLDKEFFKLNSNFELNSTFKTPNVKSHNLLKQDFLNALSTEDILNDDKFIFSVNNTLVDETKTYAECNYVIGQDEEQFASLMENLSDTDKIEKKIENQENLESIYELTGVCNLIILFHKSFKMKYVKKLLAYDLMRSFNARVRLLVEDLDARKDIIGDVQLEDPNSNDASSIEESYQTPNRIHVYLNDSSSNLVISDYVFPDETDSDICERIKELFDIEITDYSKQVIFVEDLPPEIKMSQSEDCNERLDGSGSNSNSNSGSSVNLCTKVDSNSGFLNKSAIYIGSLLVGLASIAITYYSFIAAKINDDNDTR